MYGAVSLIREADSTQVKSVITTEMGEFSFLNITTGAYFLKVEWVGYQIQNS